MFWGWEVRAARQGAFWNLAVTRRTCVESYILWQNNTITMDEFRHRPLSQPVGCIRDFFQEAMTMYSLIKILVTLSSSASIGFGVWHFFVPTIWKWYSYIDSRATELILAVRAINVFFSLYLVLFGILNLLFVYGSKANRYSIIVMLVATCILWLTRLVLQLVYPQGSINPVLQYGMLSAFIAINLCYLISLCIMVSPVLPLMSRTT
jgi:hypothetical protein